MKTLNITYDTTEIEENGKPITGETCCNLKLRDELADQLLRTGKCDPISMMHIELVLQGVELLQGRKIVLGSIKHFELVKEG